MNFKFIKWLHKWLKKRNERAYLSAYHNTTKCPHCKKWSHEKYLDDQNDVIKPKSWGYMLKCGNCGKKSRWNTVSFPFPAPCKKGGFPLNIKEIEKREERNE